MKKTLLILLALILSLSLCLTACGDNDENDYESWGCLVHNFGEWFTLKKATCTENGEMARYCDCGEKQIEILYAEGHTKVVDEAVEPTCTKTGLTEGRHCSVCDEVLVRQEIIGAKGHTEVVDEAIEPTCNKTGLTEGKHCSVCGEITVQQMVINAGHNIVVDKEIPANCQSTGLTEGSHCSACGYVFKAQQVTEITNHILHDGQYYDPQKTYNSDQDGIFLFADYDYVCGEVMEGVIECNYCANLFSHRYVYIVHSYDKKGVCTWCGEHN